MVTGQACNSDLHRIHIRESKHGGEGGKNQQHQYIYPVYAHTLPH
jgi:hypothetical protein